jgi:hypothetical protein
MGFCGLCSSKQNKETIINFNFQSFCLHKIQLKEVGKV